MQVKIYKILHLIIILKKLPSIDQILGENKSKKKRIE